MYIRDSKLTCKDMINLCVAIYKGYLFVLVFTLEYALTGNSRQILM